MESASSRSHSPSIAHSIRLTLPDLFSIFAALSEDLVFYVKTTDNECQFEKQASRKYFQ